MTKSLRRMAVRGGSTVRVLSARAPRKDAKRIARLIDEQLYPHMKALLQREPPADDGESCPHGPDGKLDVYVTTKRKLGSFAVPDGVLAFVHPFDRSRTCAPKEPVIVVVRPDVTPSILAHELFHAFSAAFDAAGDCETYSMWEEGLATWIENDVYPDEQTEHLRRQAIEDPELPMETVSYHSWVLPYFLEQRYGREIVRAIMESRERHPTTEHIARVIDGGFARHFPAFALFAWNHDPIPQVPTMVETFRDWDGYTPVPAGVDEHALALGGASRDQTSLAVHTSIRNLAREYRRITVFDPAIRQLRFENPGADLPYLHVRALVRRADGSWREENWDGKPTVRFCRDEPEEDVQEIILVYANSSWNVAEKVRAEPRIVYEDSCALHFKVLGSSISTHANASSSDLLCGTVAGEIRFAGTGGADAFDDANAITLERGRWQGEIETRAAAQWTGHALEGCTLAGVGRPRCATTMPPRRPGGDGTWPLGFSIRGEAGDDQLELRWSLDDPSVGFVDAGDPECNVHIWAPLEVEDSIRHVPRATFTGSEPFSVSFTGTRRLLENWSNRAPAVIDHAWTYVIQLQRVGSDGQPLQ